MEINKVPLPCTLIQKDLKQKVPEGITKNRRKGKKKMEKLFAKETLGGMIASLAGGCVVC